MKQYFDYTLQGTIAVFTLRIDRLLFFESAQILATVEQKLGELGFPDLIIDLRSVGTLDSAGVGFLISVKHLIDTHQRRIAVVCDNESVLRVLSITNMESFLRVCNSLEQAHASFSEGST